MDKRKLANKQVKDRLLEALITFVGHKDWSKVTVTELIAKAGVARASFYRNFTSVEDFIKPTPIWSWPFTMPKLL